jgi:hypothetical protein
MQRQLLQNPGGASRNMQSSNRTTYLRATATPIFWYPGDAIIRSQRIVVRYLNVPFGPH